jgi:hypothetical protein
LTAAEALELKAEQAAWETSYAGVFQKRDEARSATIAKDQSRTAFEEKIRDLARRLQVDPEVTDVLKSNAGLPVHSTTHTPVAVPTTAPTAMIEIPNVREHSIRMIDPANPHRGSRPTRVIGTEIWSFVGDVHPTPADWTSIAMTTRMNAKVNFNVDDIGKTAWYQFRYMNTKGQLGPWSSVYTATVTG